jgi:hypothetical protein
VKQLSDLTTLQQQRKIAKAYGVPGYLLGLPPTRWERFTLRLRRRRWR